MSPSEPVVCLLGELTPISHSLSCCFVRFIISGLLPNSAIAVQYYTCNHPQSQLFPIVSAIAFNLGPSFDYFIQRLGIRFNLQGARRSSLSGRSSQHRTRRNPTLDCEGSSMNRESITFGRERNTDTNPRPPYARSAST